MAKPSPKFITGLAVAVALIFISYIFVAGNQPMALLPGDVATSTPGEASIQSISIEPSTRDGVWTMYNSGAQVVVVGENLANVTIKGMPTGTGMGQEYPNGVTLGNAVPGPNNTWVFTLPSGVSATSLWAEAVTASGEILRSDDLGNVGHTGN